MNVKFAKRAAMVLGAATLGTALISGTAQADPTEFRQLNGVGSDTTQDVLNGISNDVFDSDGSPADLLIASYDAVNPTTGAAHENIVLRSGHPAIQRPNGSGEGIAALRNDAFTTHAGNIDFARSSSGVTDSSDASLTWVPFAKDAVALAVKSGSTLPTNVTFAASNSDLKRVYNCKDTSGNPLPAGTFPTINGVTVHPLVPQSGSGTRKFWAAQLGFSATALPSCVSDVAKDGTPVEEHDGGALQRTVTADHSEDIAPFSIAQWIAQSNSTTTHVRDRRHGVVLRSADGKTPTTGTPAALNPLFPINREVYNVFVSTRLTETDIANTFVGASSDVCLDTATITLYGFGVDPNCGLTTLKGKS
ncbi:substrate-binding domain-containing protein [Streptomyces polygonati]|uniref:Substrate-binding domain-containing protein n=1 Tax=Streptomyces polygonati TaxID=1617087 RepID=A0ABV8HP23_9ACTN